MPHRIVRYRVLKQPGHLWHVVDTMTKAVMAVHTDAHEAHQQAGTLNYQHRLDQTRSRALQRSEHQKERP